MVQIRNLHIFPFCGSLHVSHLSVFTVVWPAQSKCFGVVYCEVGGRYFVVGGTIAGCRYILTGLDFGDIISQKVLGTNSEK